MRYTDPYCSAGITRKCLKKINISIRRSNTTWVVASIYEYTYKSEKKKKRKTFAGNSIFFIIITSVYYILENTIARTETLYIFYSFTGMRCVCGCFFFPFSGTHFLNHVTVFFRILHITYAIKKFNMQCV